MGDDEGIAAGQRLRCSDEAAAGDRVASGSTISLNAGPRLGLRRNVVKVGRGSEDMLGPVMEDRAKRTKWFNEPEARGLDSLVLGDDYFRSLVTRRLGRDGDGDDGDNDDGDDDDDVTQ